MPVKEFFARNWQGLRGLGARRLLALAFTGIMVFSLVAASGYFLSRPAREVLYTGLEPQDVSRIGAALAEAGIAFDVSSEGTAVLVDYGRTSEARMLLAEKGLPKSDRSGYELFDNLGSLGLTSFMQQVTKVRALEGELARTIQLMKGVKAARVHIVLPREGSFRSLKEPPSASVVIRSDSLDGMISAEAIRFLVAAAIPGMTSGQVTVLSTDGAILASGEDSISAAPEKMVGLEKSLALDIQEKIGKTLSPYLGFDNFRVSVTAKLNTDRKKIDETTYDPESRVERSVRAFKESGEAQNLNSQAPTSVEQNIPQEGTPAAGGDQSSEKNDKREELTNYEINTKSTSTVSEGYNIDRLSIAIVVNRTKLGTGEAAATPEQVDAKLQEIQQLAASAAGLIDTRGDMIKVAAVDFLATGQELEPVPGTGMGELLLKNLGNFLNAGAMIVAVLLVLLIGLRPTVRAILELPAPSLAAGVPSLPGFNPDFTAAGGGMAGGAPYPTYVGPEPEPEDLISDLTARMQDKTSQRLAQIVDHDSDRAARILKQWLGGSSKTPA